MEKENDIGWELMKKRLLQGLVAALCLTILAGCAQRVPPMSTEELNQQFQTIFDSCNQTQGQPDDQLAAELEALSRAIDENPAFPEDAETLYQQWRAEHVVALEKAAQEEAEQVRREYEDILAGQPLYDEMTTGLCCADYIDFDGDGTQELLLLTLTPPDASKEYQEIQLDVYGRAQGHAVKYASQTFGEVGTTSIHLYQHEGKTCVGWYSGEEGQVSPHTYAYYSVDENGFSLLDKIVEETRETFPDPTGPVVYARSYYTIGGGDADGTEIPESQFKTITESYTEERELYAYESLSGTISCDRGILPEAPAPSIQVDGESLQLDTAPFIKDGCIWGPLQRVFEAMGIAVHTNSDASVIVASTKSDTMFLYCVEPGSGMPLDEYFVYFNEEQALQDTPFTDWNAAPIERLAQVWGAEAVWDGLTKTLKITGGIPESERMTQEELDAMLDFSQDDAVEMLNAKGYVAFINVDVPMPSFKNGKAYYDTISVLPSGISEEEMSTAPQIYVIVYSDGTVTELPT